MTSTFAMLILLLLIVGVHNGAAYDLLTHEQIALRAAAIESSLETVLREDLGYDSGAGTRFPGRARGLRRVDQLIGDGALFEDQPVWRVLNHFHNPLAESWSSAGLRVPAALPVVRGQSSVLWQQNLAQPSSFVFVPAPLPSLGGQWAWHNARRSYLDALTRGLQADGVGPGRDRAFGDLFEGLGHLTHLVQDATVPGHTRNDAHPPVANPDYYEEWAEDLRSTKQTEFNQVLALPAIRPSSSIFTATGNADAPVPIARLIDTDLFQGLNFEVLADPAVSIGLAEFSNGNFLSRSTIFEDFALPRVTSLDAGPLVEIQPGKFRRYFRRDREGISVDHFVAEGMLHKSVTEAIGTPLPRTWTIDDPRIHGDYGRHLLPRAVGYSAELLRYFFRGKLDVDVVPDAVDPTLVRIEGKNASPETLDGGTLSLYADVAVTDPAGVTRFVRQPATAVGSDLTVTAAPDAPVRSMPFQAPAQAERFVAVYNGTLGEERPNLDPAVDNPGAVIGKVLGGLRVEHVFPDFDSGFWMLRSPAGVFPLPIALEDIVTLRWGDADNTLVGRTAFGRIFGEPNQIASFAILRPEGSTAVPLQGGVVQLVERARVSVPFGLALGTRVELTHGIQFEQKLVTFRHEESFVDGQRTENSFSHLAVETFVDSNVLEASWALSLDFDKFTANATRPYTWQIAQVALRRDGTILALVQVTLTAPTDPNSFATFVTRKYVSPAPGCGFPCEAPVPQPGNNVGVLYAFPQSFNAIGYVVDVTNGRVLHSTAPPVVSFAHTTRATRWNDTSPNFAATEFHVVTRVDTSTVPATVVTGYAYDSGNNQRGASCAPAGGFVQFDEIHANEGTTALGAVRFRPEIAAKDAPPFFFAVVRQDRFCVGVDGATTVGYDVTTDAPRRQLAIFHFETRTRTAGEPERLVFEIEEPQVNPSDVFARIVFWDPAAGVATMHRVSTQETANIVSVGRDAAWFHASSTSIYVPREEGTLPTTFQIDFDPSLAFRVLADKRLYSADTLRFHALDPALRPTALPAVLPGGGSRFGDFHTIPLE